MGWSLAAPGAGLLGTRGVGLWLSSRPGPCWREGTRAHCDGQPEGGQAAPPGDYQYAQSLLLATQEMTLATALAASPSPITSRPSDTPRLAGQAHVQGVICPSQQCPRWSCEHTSPTCASVPRLQGIRSILLRRQAWGVFRTKLKRISAHPSHS